MPDDFTCQGESAKVTLTDMFLYVKIARDMEAECSFILRKIWLIQIGVI